jgi:hypothetical protein
VASSPIRFESPGQSGRSREYQDSERRSTLPMPPDRTAIAAAPKSRALPPFVPQHGREHAVIMRALVLD